MRTAFPMLARLRSSLLVCTLLALPGAASAQTGVSDDRVSLPDGPGSLEGVGESVSVDPNMGLLNHSVPLKLPRGYPGMTPSLALSYSSGNGGSVVGMGWSLPVSSIQRLTLRGLPEYDPADEFEAGGEQLVKMPDTDPPVYRARFEGGFVRYTWHDAGTGGGGYWTAEYPDGRIGTFGAYHDGTLEPTARLTSADGTRTFRYLLVEMRDRYGHRMEYSYSLFDGVPLLQQIGWVYPSGSSTPTYEVTLAYEDRQDMLSDCAPGFEELLTQRLEQVFVRKQGTNIRRYVLGYEDYATSGGFSRLVSVETYGKDGGLYPIVHSFAYTAGLGVECTDTDCIQPYVVDMEGSLGVAIGGSATLIDINGDSLPDVVDTSALNPTHRFWLNQLDADGTHRFLAPIDSAAEASPDLASATVQVLDINGDGFTDLMNASAGVALLNHGHGDWEPSTETLWASGDGGLPNLDSDFDPSDGELTTIRFLDYDNDKRIDVIRSQAGQTTVFRNTGGGVFQQDLGVQPIGAGFEEDNLELNDMNGDGLLDPVQVKQNMLRYKLNLGWGQWSAEWVELIGIGITTDQEAIDAELEDINGDGLADLVLVAGNTIRYWLNRNGASFDDERTVVSADVDGDIPDKSDKTVFYADMNGNGSSDIVWVDASGAVTYLELFPERPNLMIRLENNIGQVTVVSYGTSVEHAALDAADGEAWTHPLPHPMAVVESVDEWDELTDVHMVQSYLYHDGYYDGVEKAFRGYARVEQELHGDESQEAGTIYREYDLGQQDIYRKGLLLSQDARNEQGNAVKSGTSTYEDCPVAGVPAIGAGTALFDVRFLCMTMSDEVIKEGSDDPSTWVTVRKRRAYDGYGNVTLDAREGVISMGGGACGACSETDFTGEPCGAECLGDEQYLAYTFAQPEDNDDRWILRSRVRTRTYTNAGPDDQPADEHYSEALDYYDGPDFEGLSFGQVTHGSITRRTFRVDTSGAAIDRMRHRFDEHGNIVEQIGPRGDTDGTGYRRAYTYDALGLHVLEAEMTVHAAGGEPYELRQRYGWDELMDKMDESTEWHLVSGGTEIPSGESTHYRYDEFGRLTAMIRPGASEAAPSEVYTYQLANPGSAIVAQQRTEVDGPLDLESISCLDGRGREYQRRTKLSANLYHVNGFALFNAGSQIVEQFLDYTSPDAACDTAPPDGVESKLFRYDAAGRPTRVENTDGSVSRWEREALTELVYDPEDTLVGGPHEDTPIVSRVNGIAALIRVERMASPGGEPLVHRVLYDAVGRFAGVVDPTGIRYELTRDLIGRVVAVDDPDRGPLTREYDAAGNVTRETNAEGVVTVTTYDDMNRPMERWEDGSKADTVTTWTYDALPDGAACDPADCSNVAGFPSEVTYPLGDGAKGVDRFGYNLRGKLSFMQRTLGQHVFEIHNVYDHAGRTVSEILPNGESLDRTFDGLNRIVAVPGYVDVIAYRDLWLPASVEFANGVTTSWTYDVRRFVTHKQTQGPAGELLLDYTYTRNLRGLITSVLDGRADDGAPSGTATYSYDSIYRLVRADLDPDRPGHAEEITLAYDGSDRVLSKVSSLGDASIAHVGDFQYGGANGGPRAVTQAGDVDYVYDTTGMLLQRAGHSYEWDFLGRLTRATHADGELGSYGYDHAGLRVVKREQGSVTYYVTPVFEVRDGIAVTTVGFGRDPAVFAEDPSYQAQLLSDLAPASGSDEALVAAPDATISAGDAWLSQAVSEDILAFSEPADALPSNVGELLAAANARVLLPDGGQGQTLYQHKDHILNGVLTTDEQGAVVGGREYYPNGQVRYEHGTGTYYGHSAKERDEGTGLSYFGARYLDSHAGRWISPDPKFAVMEELAAGSLVDAVRVYGYVANDPINRFDPDGEEFCWMTFGAIFGGVVGAIVEVRIQHLKGHDWSEAKTEIAMAAARGALNGALTGGLSAIGDFARLGVIEAQARVIKDLTGGLDKTEVNNASAVASSVGTTVNMVVDTATGAISGPADLAYYGGKYAFHLVDMKVTEKTGQRIGKHCKNAAEAAYEKVDPGKKNLKKAQNAIASKAKAAAKAAAKNFAGVANTIAPAAGMMPTGTAHTGAK